ncbi:MAG: N-acetyltransferase family protein [Pseudomonadota bacterium]
MRDILLRPCRPGDGPALAALYRASVLKLGRRRYSEAQVQAWAGLCPNPDNFETQAVDGRWRYLAVDDAGTCLAFADLEREGRIAYFYCAPEAAGQGVAGQLYAALEAEACANGLPRLYLEASEGARGFFQRHGFYLLHRRAFQVAGVEIHNYAMEKVLPTVGGANGRG